MAMNKQSRGRLGGVFFALLGVAFCLLAARGTMESICFTEGCALTKDTSLFGLSLWWWGVGAFSLLVITGVIGFVQTAFSLSLLFLACDVFFLAWLGLGAPCLNCTVAGLLFFFSFLFFSKGQNKLFTKIMLGLWLFAFAPNLFAIGQELAAPWPMVGNKDGRVKVFFSPTCPFCLKAVNRVMRNAYGEMVLYPVAKSSEDLRRIKLILGGLQEGKAPFDAIQDMVAGNATMPDFGIVDLATLQFRLWRNKVFLTKSGAKGVPMILVNGLPPQPIFEE